MCTLSNSQTLHFQLTVARASLAMRGDWRHLSVATLVVSLLLLRFLLSSQTDVSTLQSLSTYSVQMNATEQTNNAAEDGGRDDRATAPGAATTPAGSAGALPQLLMQLYEYWEEGAGDATRFIGSEELHMTHHSCIGQNKYNRTCAFRNIYFNGPLTAPVLDHHAVWEYFVSVPESAATTDVDAVINAVNFDVAKIYTHPCLYWAETFVNSWDVRIRVFRRRPVGDGEPVPNPSGIDADGQPSIQWPGATAAASLADQLIVYPKGATDSYDAEHLHTYIGNCTLLHSARLPGVHCLPPFISSAFGVPAGYVIRGVHWNIGHTMFDEHHPYFTGLHDLGLGEHIHRFVPLYSNMAAEMGQLWGQNGLTKQTYPGLSPVHHPVLYYEFAKAHVSEVVLFRSLVVGATGRSAHSITPEYSAYGTSFRSMWLWRNHYIKGMQAAHLDNNWAKAPTPPVLNVIFLQKSDKRRILTMDALAAAVQAEYNSSISLSVMDWPQLGSHLSEVKRVLDTHIIMGVDGSGMMGAFMLPPGSVYISIPTGGHHGYPTFMGDFMINGNDHIRVLYYEGLEPGDYGGGVQSHLQVNVQRFMPLFRQAVNLVRDKFPIPVPFMQNHSPAARMLVRLQRVFPQYYERISRAWLDKGPVADRLQHSPEQFWAESIHEPISPLLTDIVLGNIGNPPSWTGP